MTNGLVVRAIRLMAVPAFLLLLPEVASAQSGIAGVVRDTSGAVLPGVTIEAASPALIEKVRTVVTDSDGTYKIVDLRPGVYAVTFTLTGFNTVKRDGIDLPAAFTATVNAELQVGAVEETITVTGAAPLVDVQNAGSQRIFSPELLESIPASRSPQGFTALTPGNTNAGGLGGIPGSFNELNNSLHGAPEGETIYAVDGINTATVHSGGGGQSTFFRIPQSYVAEIAIATGGGTAEQAFGGPVTNVIPKEGGNTFGGNLFIEYTGDGLPSASNLTPALEAQGFNDNNLADIVRLWEISGGVGGRLVRDKLWFFGSYRTSGTIQTRPGMYENLTPQGWQYTPDLTRIGVGKLTNLNRNLRLTWQVTPRNKISIFGDSAPHIEWTRNWRFSISPEATTYTPYKPNAFLTASWKSPVTSRLLLDATISHNSSDDNLRRHTPETCRCLTPAVSYSDVSVVESTTATMWRAATNLVNPGGQDYGHFSSQSWQYSGSASYITGSHAAKAGMQMRHGSEWLDKQRNGARAYLLRNGLPSSITQYADPILYENELHAEIGVYLQDQWTRKRLTVTGGLRYDFYDGGTAPQHLDAGLWVPARDFPAIKSMPNWRDVNPRIAAAYDLFGDARTAVKATLGRFVAGQGLSGGGVFANHPVVRSVLQVSRTWNDANGNFNPDCDLVSRFANGECGQMSDLNFGQNNPNATVWEDELIGGLRSYSWETTLGLQRQLAQGISVGVGYYHREFSNFLVTDNLLVGPGDFSTYCVAAPVDARLPDGGGNRMCGLYDVVPALFGRNQSIVRSARHFGDQEQVYDGVDVTESVRLPMGATISGGVNWGRTRTNTCFVVDSPGALRFCEVTPPFRPNFSFVGLVPLPVGFVVSATYRDYPGTEITATRTTSNAEIAPSLGRNLSNGANGTVNIPLIEPGTMFAPRPRQLDLRFSKRFRFGRTRLMGNLDLYNLLNWTGINVVNLTYGANWQRPTVLQQGRYIKLSGQVDF
jgi:hypothetical protein